MRGSRGDEAQEWTLLHCLFQEQGQPHYSPHPSSTLQSFPATPTFLIRKFKTTPALVVFLAYRQANDEVMTEGSKGGPWEASLHHNSLNWIRLTYQLKIDSSIRQALSALQRADHLPYGAFRVLYCQKPALRILVTKLVLKPRKEDVERLTYPLGSLGYPPRPVSGGIELSNPQPIIISLPGLANDLKVINGVHFAEP
ncbi:uncharacterized protein BDR25DRAFT_351606 [Lindgomyces ingoldianus]|uniref:Uncharacterized protein n=1 Tax=Lindgomyces ingoldianus TaxID=673940 RepID=A0ACB6R4J9_9PLEO|nr:uncharacterized protein BDR25DRAFT_351606 [Lindgomyces ingoldianus]KAF2474071.1 hypothetical protein BDR25DRAFT_351606 [Lindgomyces ingoldianus]